MLNNLTCFAFTPEQIVFFGDSLSDNGNLYHLLLKIIPKSPPYFEGRFSNGPTWAENLGTYFYNQFYIDYKIYAYGGATAILHTPTDKFIAPMTLENEINQYTFDSIFKNKHAVLYAIWIGGNDYLFDATTNDIPSREILTNKVVAKIVWSIETLISQGAKHFLILNMPDLSFTPFAKTNGLVDKLHDLSVLHNRKLDAEMINLKNSYPKVQFTYIDIYKILNELITDPGKFNDMYHVNITDTVHACWEGGYTFARTIEEINRDGNLNQLSRDSHFPLNGMIRYSPALAESFRVNLAFNRGLMPCNNADEYIFWDQIHPTKIVHYILAEYILENLNLNIT